MHDSGLPGALIFPLHGCCFGAIVRVAMTSRSRIAVGVLLLGTTALAQPQGQQGNARAQPAQTTPWKPAHLLDGQPDVQGMWSSVLGGTVSLTNPVTGGADFDQRITGKFSKNPSRIIDPSDGKVPYQPWAAALQARQQAEWENPTRPEHIDTQNRCMPSPQRLFMLPSLYQVTQTAAQIVFVWDDYHAYRIVPLDGRPHPGPNVKLWMGDSRGHWEGSTLVIDTTNLNGKPRLSVHGDFFSSNAHVTERLTFTGADAMNYDVTIDDPTVFTRPWTMRVAQRRRPIDEIWEFSCHEGEKNSDILLPAAQEKK
jgi:hypothetical protein